MPKISIVTTVYNHKPFLRDLVRYNLVQTESDFEWFIIDDDSPDGSGQLLEKILPKKDNIKLIRNEINVGASESIRRILSKIQGKYLYRQDGDDLIHPNFLEKMAKPMEDNQNISISACKCIYLDQHNNSWGRKKTKSYYLKSEELTKKLLSSNFLCAPGILYRTRAIVDGNAFKDLKDLRSRDWYMNLVASLYGDLNFEGNAFAAYRLHNNNYSKTLYRSGKWEDAFAGCFSPLIYFRQLFEKSSFTTFENDYNNGLANAAKMAHNAFIIAKANNPNLDEDIFLNKINELVDYSKHTMTKKNIKLKNFIILMHKYFTHKKINKRFKIDS
jgi:glycosyltransferase involved in cell wall biosynthesis